MKTENVHYPGLLKPLPIPKGPRQDIPMDFIERLPHSGHKNSILVVIDILTKYANFIPLKHLYTAKKDADVFLKEIYKLHELPKSIVIEKDPLFTSQFWQQMFKSLGTKLNMSTSNILSQMARLKGSIDA